MAVSRNVIRSVVMKILSSLRSVAHLSFLLKEESPAEDAPVYDSDMLSGALFSYASEGRAFWQPVTSLRQCQGSLVSGREMSLALGSTRRMSLGLCGTKEDEG